MGERVTSFEPAGLPESGLAGLKSGVADFLNQRASSNLDLSGEYSTSVEPRSGVRRDGLRQEPHDGFTQDVWNRSCLLFLQERESYGAGVKHSPAFGRHGRPSGCHRAGRWDWR